MKLPAPERDGRPLVGRGFLLVFAAVLLGVAAMLHPDLLGFRSWLYEGELDPVATELLELELREHPEDRALRQAYARQLLAAGRLDEAADVAAVLAYPPYAPGDFELAVRVTLARVRASEGAKRYSLEASLRRLLHRGEGLALPSAAYLELSRAAHEVGEPGLAARFLDRAIEVEALERLGRAARLYQEAELQEVAADRWLAFAQLELQGAARPELLERAVRALVAAGRVDDARSVVQGWLQLHPRERLALDLGVELAWAQAELELAFERSLTRVAIAPDDPGVLDAHVALALARGRPNEALQAARRLMARLPGDRRAAEQRARVAEWSGRPREALTVWFDRAKAGDRRARVEAERIALGLDAREVLLVLTRQRISEGQLEPAIVERLVYLAESMGAPEEAREALAEATARPGAPKALWLRLARLERRMGRLVAASLTWDELAGRFPLEDTEVVEQAELTWRVRGPEAALDLLLAHGSDDTEVQRLIADLSFRLGRRGPALAALRRLMEQAELRDYEALRALRVAVSEGRIDEALRFVEHGLERGHGVDVLLGGLSLAVDRGRLARARRLLGLNPGAEREARSLTSYWRLRAELARLEGRRQEARAAFERVLELDPGAPRAKVDLLWLLIDLDDRAGLTRWLARFEPPARRPGTDSALLAALAAARVHLGQDRAALPWFARIAEGRPERWQFWLDYALTLERAGRTEAGIRLRKYALRLVPEEDAAARFLVGTGVLPEAELGLAARAIVESEDGSGPVARAAVAYLLDRGELDRVEETLATAPPRAAGWRDLGLLFAVGRSDRPAVMAWLDEHEGSSSPALEAEAWALVGRFDRALERAMAAREQGEGRIARAALERFVVPGHFSSEVEGVVEARRLGRLDSARARASARTRLGSLQLAVLAAIEVYDDAPGRALGAERTAAVELAVRAVRRWASGQVAMRGGVHAQPDGPALPQAELEAMETLDRRFRVLLALELSAVVDETPTLETLAARDRVRGELGFDLGHGLGGSVSGSLEHHVGRGRETLGYGTTVSARIGQRILRGPRGLEVTAFGSGVGALRDATGLPEPLRASGLAPSDVLPERFLALGAGLRVGAERGRAAWFLEGWLGGQWPIEGVAYRAEAGWATPLLGPDRLSLSAGVGNVVSGVDGERVDLSVGYQLELP